MAPAEFSSSAAPVGAADKLLSQVLLARAARLARGGHHDEAATLLTNYSSTEQAEGPVLDLLARIRAQQGRVQEAQSLWTRATQIDPSNERYRAGLRRLARKPREILSLGGVSRLAAAVGIAWLAIFFGSTVFASLGRLESSVGDVSTQVAALQQAVATLKPPTQVSPVEAAKPTQNLVSPVQLAFQKDAVLGTLVLSVRQVGSSIKLDGAVPSEEVKMRAEGVARTIEGVEAVDSGGLVIAPVPLRTSIEAALSADPRLNDARIEVRQEGTSIRLRGIVTSDEQRAIAESTVTGAGAGLVDSHELTVSTPSLANTVRTALTSDPRVSGLSIEVTQVARGVRLTGSVPSVEVKNKVGAVARGVPGVELVDDVGVQVEPTGTEYVVQSGDTLSSIAAELYGDERKWPLILAANWDQLLRPDHITPGTHLLIPPQP